MPSPHHIVLGFVIGGGAVPAVCAQAADPAAAGGGMAHAAALILAGLAAVAASVGIVLALQSRRLAAHAAQEAGEARARANQGGASGVTPEALAGVERVWSARLAALEARLLPSGGARPAPVRDAERPPEGIAVRLDELDRVVAGLAVSVKELRRPAPAPAAAPAAPARAGSDVAWPACLAADTAAMNDVRQSLALALKSRDSSARELLDRLRATEHWAAKKPGASEVAAELAEISTLLLAALRRGAAVAPLDGSLLSDRVLAALRASWKSFLPQLDCRSFYPGTTFDPDWMEDRTRAGLQRPVISEMLSWAVFEKLDASRRILAKARVTAE